jgi:ubiquinol-cytochrome c reductase cytochrome c subunit
LNDSTPTQVAEAVRVGPGTMPIFGENAIGSRELSDLAVYVQALQSPRDRGGYALWHLGPLPEGMLALASVAVLAASLAVIGARR